MRENIQNVRPAEIKHLRWGVMIFLFTFQFFVVSNKMLIGLASVPIMEDYALSATQWGLVGSSFYWLYSICSVGIGAMADRTSAKKSMGIVAAIWTLVNVVTVTIIKFPVLIISRVLMGASQGPNQAVTMVMVGRNSPKSRLGFASSIPLVGGNVGASVMAPLSVFMISQYGWKALFILMAVLSGIWTVAWLIFGKEYPKVAKDEETVEVVPEVKQDSGGTWAEAFKSLLNRNAIIIALAGFFGSYWFYSLLQVWLTNYMETVRGVSASVMAFPTLVALAGQVGFSTISDALYKKTGNIKKARVSMLTLAMLLGAAAVFVMTITGSNAVAVVCMCIGALGMSWVAIGPTVILQVTDPKHHGKAVGLVTGIATMAGVVAPVITGGMIDAASSTAAGFQNVFFLTTAFYAVFALILWFGFKEPEQKAGE